MFQMVFWNYLICNEQNILYRMELLGTESADLEIQFLLKERKKERRNFEDT